MTTQHAGDLSTRGAQLANEPPLAEYILEHFARAADPFDPATNPDGYIALCIAENKQLSDLLAPWLSPDTSPPEHVLGYDAMLGKEEFRTQLAAFLDRAFLGRRYAPEQIAVLCGAGTVLEFVFYALADAGEAVLVPTPSYSGFWPDLQTRDALHIVPVHCPSEDGFRLTPARLDAALAAADRPVRALLFTNPDNPLGRVTSPAEIRQVVHWAQSNGLHVVFDEIYALSTFGAQPFTSVASVVAELGDHVHIVWAFSKDFGASGLRCGLLVSENQALLSAVDGLAYWAAVSGHTQWLLGRMIADTGFVDRFRRTLRERLGSTYGRVTAALTAAGIPYLPADAGIFVLCDLRGWLAEPSFAAERALWRRLVEEARVNITPGEACRIAEPGFFRLCYMAESPEAVLTGIRRVQRVLAPPR